MGLVMAEKENSPPQRHKEPQEETETQAMSTPRAVQFGDGDKKSTPDGVCARER
jgi:phage-related protein